jgi:hypothetical protein
VLHLVQPSSGGGRQTGLSLVVTSFSFGLKIWRLRFLYIHSEYIPMMKMLLFQHVRLAENKRLKVLLADLL